MPAWYGNFHVFYAGVGERPEGNFRLYPINRSEPLGPGNFQWTEVPVVEKIAGEDAKDHRRRQTYARRDLHGTTRLDSDMRKKYGIGIAEFKAMMTAQRGLCAICGQPEKHKMNGRIRGLAIDHDHRTGKARELLCQNCNHLIGCVDDDKAILLKAVDYLDKHKAHA